MCSMLSAIPPVISSDTYTLWSPFFNAASAQHDSEPAESHGSMQYDRSTRRRTAGNSQVRQPSELSRLIANEDRLALRKAGIKYFGCTWLRPPGVSKTLQAMMDEARERREAEEAARREAAQAAEQEAAQVEAWRRGEADDHGLQHEQTQDRDLDGDVPDAEAHDEDDEDEDDDDDTDDTDDEDDSEGDEDEGQIYNHPSEGTNAMEDDEHAVTGLRGARELTHGVFSDEDLIGAGDLDDDVPDAGSYQHTDTDIESSSDSSESELDVDMARNGHEHEPEEHVGHSSNIHTPPSNGTDAHSVARGPTVIQQFRVPLSTSAALPATRAMGLDSRENVIASSPVVEGEGDSSFAMSSPMAARPPTARHGGGHVAAGRPLQRQLGENGHSSLR